MVNSTIAVKIMIKEFKSKIFIVFNF